MKQAIVLVAAGVVAGAAVVLFIPRGTGKAPETAADEPGTVISEVAAPARESGMARETPQAPRRVEQQAELKPKAPVVSAWARLAEKYGPEKTALSSKITSNLTSVIEDGINLGKTWAKNAGSGSVAEAATKEIMRGASRDLALNETQQQQASALIQSVIERRMNAVADLTSAMHTEPEQIMSMLLAGDSLARNEITRQQYDEMTLPTRTMLQNLAGFVTGQSGSGGLAQLVGDQATADQLNAILNPEQQAKLAEFAAKVTERAQARQQRNNFGSPFQSGEIPVMDLEKLDQSIASVKKMTEAARLMMEGMQGLKQVKDTGPGSGPGNP